MDEYDKACEDYAQDLKDGERPDPWDYLPGMEDHSNIR